MATTRLSACSARRRTTTRLAAREGRCRPPLHRQRTRARPPPTTSATAQGVTGTIQLTRATQEHGKDQCSRSGKHHPRQRKGHMVRAHRSWHPSTQTTRTTLPPPADRIVGHNGEVGGGGGAPSLHACSREEVTINSLRGVRAGSRRKAPHCLIPVPARTPVKVAVGGGHKKLSVFADLGST